MNAERKLMLFLRFVGGVMVLAFVAVVMPFGWMDAIHRLAGLGALPNAPIVHYLTRSASTLYAGYGLVLWFYSRDVKRYRPAIQFQGRLAMGFGVIMLAVDLMAGMPWHWTAMEGPVVIVLGLVITALVRRLPPA
jgi:hypothetical protein